jgi:hypothetical protein
MEAQPAVDRRSPRLAHAPVAGVAWQFDPLVQKGGEEYRQVDHPAAPVLRRPEAPAGVHVLVHRAELRIDLVDSPARTTEPFRLQAKITISGSCAGRRCATAITVPMSTATPTRTGCP